MASETLLLIKQVRPAASKINNLRTPIPILFESGTLKAVKGVGDALAATDDTFILVVAEGALIANTDKRGRAYVRIAYRAFAVAFIAEPSNSNA